MTDFALVLCLTLYVGASLLRTLGFMSALVKINYKITTLEQLMIAPELKQKDFPFYGKNMVYF